MATNEMPSDPNKQKLLKAMIVEMTNAMARADGEKDHIKEIAKEASEQFEIDKSTINKLAKTMYKQDFASLQAENEKFEQLYEALQMVKAVTS